MTSSWSARETVVTPRLNAVAMVFSVGFLLREANQYTRFLVCFVSVVPPILPLFRVIPSPSCPTVADEFPAGVAPVTERAAGRQTSASGRQRRRARVFMSMIATIHTNVKRCNLRISSSVVFSSSPCAWDEWVVRPSRGWLRSLKTGPSAQWLCPQRRSVRTCKKQVPPPRGDTA